MNNKRAATKCDGCKHMTITTPSGFCPKCEFFKNDVSNAVKHKRPGGKPR